MAAPSLAQEPPPLVVFVEEPASLAMASVTDNGPDGLTRLAEIFQRLGARTTWIRLRDPLPPDARVIVLVRPRRPLSAEDLARVWQQVGAGSSLLVALDPQGYMGTRTENSGSGLDTLITLDQGVSIRNGILLHSWFSTDSLNALFSSFSFGYADPVPHPITDPVQRYDLPVALWGARPVHAEAIGIDSAAWTLVDALPEYVETNMNIFPTRTDPGVPFELNLHEDQLGRVEVAAIGENTEVGSRVAVLGDGEFVQNGYGLALSPDSGTPVYSANTIITERLAAWLLNLPEEAYPELPANLTWIALDGNIEDWAENAAITVDSADDTSILSLNVQQVRAFHNDSYVYLSVETVSQANLDSQIDLEIDADNDGTAETFVTMLPDQVMLVRGGGEPVVVTDADMGIDTVIELRLPLRVSGNPPRIANLCLSSARELAFPQPPDCMEVPIDVARVSQTDPAPLRLTSNTLVAVRGDGANRINLRAEPSTEGRVLTTVSYGTVFAAVGRSADGAWVQVQNAAYTGWISVIALFPSVDLSTLPQTSP